MTLTGIGLALTGLHGLMVYAAIGALIALEASLFIGLVFPGETALLVGGVLAERGQIALPMLLAVGCIAAVAGDSVGYAIGHRLGPTIERSRIGHRVGDERWSRARAFVDRHGWWAVILGRWTSVLRALVPTIVGMIRMPYRRFAAANAAGGITWVVAIVMIGYGAGGSVARAQTTATRVGLAGVTVAVAVFVSVVWRQRRSGSVGHQRAGNRRQPGGRASRLD